MTERARFTLQLALRDNYDFGQPLVMCIDVDREVRISARAVEEMKIGLAGFDGAVQIMRVREFRKDLFIDLATRLGALLAERMEDAEGWHDASMIEPARQQLGGDWKSR